jgi:hypothetical protein
LVDLRDAPTAQLGAGMEKHLHEADLARVVDLEGHDIFPECSRENFRYFLEFLPGFRTYPSRCNGAG